MSDFVIDRLGVAAFLATKGFELDGTVPRQPNNYSFPLCRPAKDCRAGSGRIQ